jgi:hypothetical protein
LEKIQGYGDKTEPEDTVVLENQRERGVQPTMGGAYTDSFTMDM